MRRVDFDLAGGHVEDPYKRETPIWACLIHAAKICLETSTFCFFKFPESFLVMLGTCSGVIAGV